MATKAQKRARNEAKREKFMEDYRADGLKAQKRDHDRRERENWERWRNQHDKQHVYFDEELDGWNYVGDEPSENCPLCAKGVLHSKKV